MICRLCLSTGEKLVLKGKDGNAYYRCGSCRLILMDDRGFPAMEEERARYLSHNNVLQNEGYVEFLNSVIEPTFLYLSKDMRGLDYGCGPVPVLSELLRQRGIHCDHYDPFFFHSQLNGRYDFIFSTETFEHFFSPREEIKKITERLRSQGFLAIMTELWSNKEEFPDWYYPRDPTHVTFYHRSTFDYICGEFGYRTRYTDGRRVIILQKE